MVADLIDSLILSKGFKLRTEPKKKNNIFHQIFHHKKNFHNIDMYKFKFKMYNKLVAIKLGM